MGRKKIKQSSIDKRIEKIYNTPNQPGSYAGLSSVYHSVNRDKENKYIPKSRVLKWLKSNRSYSMYEVPRRKFKRRKVVVSGLGVQWQADLVDMRLSKDDKFDVVRQNQLKPEDQGKSKIPGATFFLSIIDVFSKFAYVRPLLTKEGINVTQAFEDIKKAGAKLPIKLQTDKGTEFRNSHFRSWCEKNGISHFHSEDDTMKGQIVERLNYEIEKKIHKYFAANLTVRWVDVVQELTESYNKTYNRNIGMAPSEVTYDNQHEVFQQLHPPEPLTIPKAQMRYKIGDYVRLAAKKGVFDRGYKSQWSPEVFTVADVQQTGNGQIVIYRVNDLNKEPIIGTFYYHELRAATKPGYIIDYVISTKGDKSLVKWLDRPDSSNSYVENKHLKKFANKDSLL